MVLYMVCLDFSPTSIKAFNTAQKLVDPSKDEVLLVTVVELYTHSIINTLKVDWDFQILDEANQKMVKEAQEMMQAYADKLSHAGIKVQVVVEAGGDPREKIVELTEKHQPDTLIVGSRGLSPVQKLVIGSVSDYCLRSAKAGTVLIVH